MHSKLDCDNQCPLKFNDIKLLWGCSKNVVGMLFETGILIVVVDNNDNSVFLVVLVFICFKENSTISVYSLLIHYWSIYIIHKMVGTIT